MTWARRKFKKKTLTPEQLAAKVRGIKAKANGAKAEAIVMASANYFYLQDKQIILHKRNESLQAKTGADFACFTSTGKSGYIECKSRNAKSIPLDAVQPHQIEQLQELEAMGFIGAVIVRLVVDEVANWFYVPAKNWSHPSKKSLSLVDLEKYRINIIETDGGDYLDLVTAINEAK